MSYGQFRVAKTGFTTMSHVIWLENKIQPDEIERL